MNTAPTITPATADDRDTIVAFNIRLAAESESKRLDRAVVERGVEAVLERPELGRYFLARRNGDTVGQMMITFEWSDWRNGMFWWVQSVYVHPDHRRTGVFRALFGHVEQAARDDGAVCGLRLYVESENGSAISTYERLGMKRPGYFVCEKDWSDAIG